MSVHFPLAAIKLALDRKYPGYGLADQMTREFYRRDAIVRVPFMVGEWKDFKNRVWDAHGDVNIGERVQTLAFTNGGFRGIEAIIAATSPRTGDLITKYGVGVGHLILPSVLPGARRVYVDYASDPRVQSQYNRRTTAQHQLASDFAGPRGDTELRFIPPRLPEE